MLIPGTAPSSGPRSAVPATAAGQVGNSVTTPTSIGRQLYGGAETGTATATTVFGIFQDNHFEFMLSALRQNGLVKILAEPNLVALSGQRASFLAGGEYPVPIPQVSGSGVAPTITVTFKQFGVLLSFLPTIIDDDVIRLAVAPEVSEIDNVGLRHARRRWKPGPGPDYPQGRDDRRAAPGTDPRHGGPAPARA